MICVQWQILCVVNHLLACVLCLTSYMKVHIAILLCKLCYTVLFCCFLFQELGPPHRDCILEKRQHRCQLQIYEPADLIWQISQIWHIFCLNSYQLMRNILKPLWYCCCLSDSQSFPWYQPSDIFFACVSTTCWMKIQDKAEQNRNILVGIKEVAASAWHIEEIINLTQPSYESATKSSV